MDSALKAGLVVDVLQEIGLDIDDRAAVFSRGRAAPSACRSGRSEAPSRGRCDSKRSAGMRPGPSWTASSPRLSSRAQTFGSNISSRPRGCGSITIRGLAMGLLPKRFLALPDLDRYRGRGLSSHRGCADSAGICTAYEIAKTASQLEVTVDTDAPRGVSFRKFGIQNTVCWPVPYEARCRPPEPDQPSL